MKMCTAALGSLTNAMKAQRVLSEEEIEGTIVKLEASMTRKGCAYGVEFPCNRFKEVRALMSAQGIRVSNYINGSGGTVL